jgi:hypothetical protein
MPKISELTNYTSPLAADEFVIVEEASSTTKKVRYDNLLDLPHATILDTTTQAIANVTEEQAITLNTTAHASGITHSTSINPSRIYVDTAGEYVFTVSAVVDLASGTNQTLNIWFKHNGEDIANSNTLVTISGSARQTLSVTAEVHMAGNDYIELFMAGTSTGVQIESIPAQTNPTIPVCPSIVVSVFKVSSS